mgnify:CR=1 FL=1
MPGEQVLRAGMCAGFPTSADGKTGDGHQLINRGSEPAVYLEISNRDKADRAFYSGRRPAFPRRRRRGDVHAQGRQRLL